MSIFGLFGSHDGGDTTTYNAKSADGTYDQYQNQYQGLAAAQAQQAAAYQLANSSQQFQGAAGTQNYGAAGANAQYAGGLANQQGAMNQLQQVAMNGYAGPSVAQAQLQQGLNSSLAQQQSMAASATGGGYNQASAQRAAMMNGASLDMNANAQASLLRAQETANNNQYKANALGAYSGMANNQAAQGYQQQQMAQGQAQYDRTQSDAEKQAAVGNQYAGLASAYAAGTGKYQAQLSGVQANNNTALGQQSSDTANGLATANTVSSIAGGIFNGAGAQAVLSGSDKKK
jgi:hypothetical protein